MFRRVMLAGVLSLLALMIGCTSVARRLDVSTARQVQPGMHYREVEQMLRAPDEVVRSADQKVVVRYFFTQFLVSNQASAYQQLDKPGDMLVRMLTLQYDEKGTVRRKIHDETVNPVRRLHTGWYEFGPLLETNTVSIQPKSDTAADVIKRFGEPISRSLDSDGNDVLIWYYFRERPDYLGQAVARRLTVSLDAAGQVIAYKLTDEISRPWFRH
jgi:hypothetical protein